MRKVADELGVQAMSLYHHVSGKEEILDGVVDLIFSEIALPRVGSPWRSALHARASSAREVLRHHPWALGLMDSRPNPGPSTLAHHNAVIGVLREEGFSIGMAAHAFSLLDSYVYGFAIQEASLPFDGPGEVEDVAAGLGELAAAYPYLAEMVTDHVLQPGYSYSEEFDIGLDLVLDAVETLRTRGLQR